MEIKKSTILLSQPYQGDPDFDWTVILLCNHDNNGSFGFVLNDYANMQMKDIVEGFENTHYPLFFGGPVDNDALFYIHKIKDLRESIEVCKGVYVHGDFDELKARIKLGEVKNEDIRFFLGYSGWDKDQLKGEINRNSWFLNNSHSTQIMNMKVDTLWRDVLKEMGGEFK